MKKTRKPRLLGPVTKRQQRVLDWVKDFVAEHQYPPTRGEIAKGLRFKSANAAHEHLASLARKGAIRLTLGISRGIVVL